MKKTFNKKVKLFFNWTIFIVNWKGEELLRSQSLSDIGKHMDDEIKRTLFNKTKQDKTDKDKLV